MKLVVLSDNRTNNAAFESEHGLSVYVEMDTYRCLFDTGASGIFIRNAAKADVDLSKVDYVFISHGHSDHIGGLEHFLKINTKAQVILSKNVFNQQLFSNRNGFREIGISMDITKYHDRFIFVEDELAIVDEINVYTVKSHPFSLPKGNQTLFKGQGTGIEPDDFNHEIVVTLGRDDLFVFTGCAHHGVLNMLATVAEKTGKNIRYVFGGFHLLDSSGLQYYEAEDEIREIARVLQQQYPDTEFFTGHCSGDNACSILKKELKSQLDVFSGGYYWKSTDNIL